MKSMFLAGVALAASLIVAGCNNTATTANKAAGNTAAPAAPAAPAGNATDGAAGGGEEGGQAGDATNQNFTLVNNSGHVIMTLNVSPADENEWGPDILGRDTLANGESAEITFPRAETACQWDIRATFDDNTSGTGRYNLCELTTVTVTPS